MFAGIVNANKLNLKLPVENLRVSCDLKVTNGVATEFQTWLHTLVPIWYLNSVL